MSNPDARHFPIRPAAGAPDRRAGLVRVAARHWWVVLGVNAACVAAAAVYVALARPVYVGDARLQVRSSAPKSLGETLGGAVLGGAGGGGGGMNFLSTQCEMIKSTPVLSAAVRQVEPGQSPDAVAERVATLKIELQVEPGKRDDLIRVAAGAPTPDGAAALTNAVVAAYVDYVGQLKRDESNRMLELLKVQMAQCRQESAAAAEAMRRFRDRNADVPYDNGRANIVAERLASLSEAFTRDHLQSVAAESIYESGLQMMTQPDGVAKCAELYRQRGDASMLDHNRDELRLSLVQSKERWSLTQERLFPGHPSVMGLRQIIDELQRQIDVEDRREADTYLSQVRQDWQQARRREQEDQKELDEQKLVAGRANATAIAYAGLQADLERAQRQADELDTRMKALGVTKETGSMDVTVVEPAVAPAKPAKPDREKLFAAAAAVGLMLGVVTALGRDRADTRLRSSADVVAALGRPVLGLIPRLNASTAGAGPDSPFGQSPAADAACLVIRRGIKLVTGPAAPRTILVCSADPRAGTSTLTRHLAMSFARGGRRVLWIDASGSTSAADDGAAALGLRQLLSGTHSINAVVQKTATAGVDFLGRGSGGDGAAAGDAGAALDDGALAAVMKRLSVKYQLILVDGPAVAPLGDACMWASVCQATLLVLRAGRADHRSASLAMQSLREVGANVIGAVINHVAPGAARDGTYRVQGCRPPEKRERRRGRMRLERDDVRRRPPPRAAA